ncbi:hypothetical protein N658DRAFT_300970 [Parathielavia hyrcaniae]|uniref:Uncharacterized protein n=1 Tax=Parathielavia hyrcaniae TaxID=113614 RepID=A0AAN6Q6G3_9PEZI|nr:hypothetical protein N658DRAFT_300970 [Parathielavia hyrcaniae]
MRPPSGLPGDKDLDHRISGLMHRCRGRQPYLRIEGSTGFAPRFGQSNTNETDPSDWQGNDNPIAIRRHVWKYSAAEWNKSQRSLALTCPTTWQSPAMCGLWEIWFLVEIIAGTDRDCGSTTIARSSRRPPPPASTGNVTIIRIVEVSLRIKESKRRTNNVTLSRGRATY